MAKLSFLKDKLLQLSSFLEKYYLFTNAHMVDFITHGYWYRLLSPQLQEELLKFDRIVDNENSSLQMLIKHFNEENTTFIHLKSFLEESGKHSLGGLGVCSEVENVVPHFIENSDFDIFPSHLNEWLMPKKKKHEVEMMGKLIALLSSQNKTDVVVDFGSGKGYLSFCLAVKHKLKVLGLDSQATNTCGASIRTERMLHAWKKSLAKRLKSEDNSSNNTSTTWNNNQTFDSNDSNCENVNNQLHNNRNNLNNGQSLTNNETSVKSNKFGVMSSEEGVFYPVTTTVNKDTDLKAFLRKFERALCQDGSLCDDSVKITKLLMCGLHTCGNLASNMIHLFLSNNEAKLLCNVGCCYHKLEEETEEFFKLNDAKDGNKEFRTEFDFPLSATLKEHKFKLGRNARMLSAQPLERIYKNKMTYPKSLFYRAILQSILVDKFGNDAKLIVGKIPLKSESFVEYVRKVEKKFTGLNLQISDDELMAYLTRYKDEEKKLIAFQHLRCVLAPSIEAVVLLDRLVYLHEQKIVEDAHLIKLFDPVTSPRCYALLAMKKE